MLNSLTRILHETCRILTRGTHTKPDRSGDLVVTKIIDSEIIKELLSNSKTEEQTEPSKTEAKTCESSPKIQFKIGMIAPAGSGKTSLISAICSEVQERLTSEPLEFWPVGTKTQEAMQRAFSAFNAAINNPKNLFLVPKLSTTTELLEYQFAVTIPKTGQEIGFSILDYPGQYLGSSEFSHKITPYLLESVALFVPISSDILMYWNDTTGLPGNMENNAAANYMLDCDNIKLVIRNWISRKKEIGAPAQLFFVPIKCEKYFNDNGGDIDDHEKLINAVKTRYIEPLKMTPEEKSLIQTNIYCVDTYGVVELLNIDAVKAKNKEGYEQLTLESKFIRRIHLDKKRRSKNAYELLISILKYQIENRFKIQEDKTLRLKKKSDEFAKEAQQIRFRHQVAKIQAEIQKRKDSYSFFGPFWYTFFRNEELERLEREANNTGNQLKSAEEVAKSVFNEYQLNKQECDALKNAVDILTKLLKSMPIRQHLIK